MQRTLRRRSILFLALVIALILSFASAAGSAPVQLRDVAPPGPTVPEEAEGVAPDGLFWCTVTDVWVIAGAVGVNCSPGSGDIRQFAYPTAGAADSRQADRLLTIANTALVLNKRIWLGFNDSASANPPGCNTTSCRRATSMLIQP